MSGIVSPYLSSSHPNDMTEPLTIPPPLSPISEAEGNNVVTPNDVTPPYNTKMGFLPGAQNDIFATPTHLGCYADTNSPRVLPTKTPIPEGPTQLTQEKCVAA